MITANVDVLYVQKFAPQLTNYRKMKISFFSDIRCCTWVL